MSTVLVGARPPEVEELIQRRRALGQDLFDPSGEIVVEIVSPDDESRMKFDFYFRAGVKEVLIVDPAARTVEWFVRDESGFRPAEGSSLLDVTAAELHKQIDWP